MRDHLVVVPGIGGSVLALPGRPEERLWEAGFRDIGDILLRPERLSLGEHEHLEPVGLIRTRKAFGVWTAIPGYDRLLSRLGELPGAVVDDGTPAGRGMDANVVAVPYDFRRSITEAAEHLDRVVKARLKGLWPNKDHEGRLLIIAHSMGGLVARYWAAEHENWRLCRSLISLGTPHRGAPKALEVLANGIPVRDFHVRRPRAVLREWPSVAELLPRYPAVLPVAGGEALRPHEVPLPWLAAPAQAAFDVHRVIEKGWGSMPRDGGPEVVPRIGYGHPTLTRCTWDGEQIRVDNQPAGIPGLGAWDADMGDGTVPAFSGLPLELDRHLPRDLRVPLRHGPIAALDEVIGLIEGYEGRPPHLPVRGQERPVVLGVGLEDVTLTDAPTPLTAAVVGAPREAHISAVSVWASVRLQDNNRGPSAGPVRLDWHAREGRFVGELPALAAGIHEVTVSAEATPGAGDLSTSHLIEVVTDEQLE